MRTFRQHRSMLMYAVLGLAAVVMLASPATAAYNQGSNQQGQGQGNQSGQRGPMRNMQIEQQLATQLRNEGYGEQGQIMILTLGDRVVLLGTVPSDTKKTGAADLAKSLPGVKSVDNRLHVEKKPKEISNTQLEKNIDNNLPDNLRKTVKVQAQNGVVTLTGHAQNWNEVADAIDAAFSAGAQEVVSRFTISGVQGYQPSYGYVPSQTGAAGGQATVSDLRLAQQVAMQLRWQLPPQENVQLVQPQSVYVTAHNGTVTLHGYVQDFREKVQAAQMAHTVPGVKTVTNDLVIFNPQSASAQAGFQGAPSAGWQGGYYQPQGYMPGQPYQQQGTAGQSQWGPGGYYGAQGYVPGEPGYGAAAGQGQYGAAGRPTAPGAMGPLPVIPDWRLAQTIQQQLRNQFPNTDINVTANQGIVTLQGSVANFAEKQQAEQFAYSIPGVQSVQNNLMVGGPGGMGGPSQFGQGAPQGFGGGMGSQGQFGQGALQSFGGAAGPQATLTPSDMALAQQVAMQVRQVAGIRNVEVMRPDTIYVSASQGTITLSGFVPSWLATQQATQIARAIPGVRNVQSTLGIAAGAGGGFYPSYGYVPGREGQGFQGQPGLEGQPGTGMGGQGTGGAELSQTAYSDQPSITRQPPGTAGAPSLPPMGTSPADTALAWQLAQRLQQQLPNLWVQVIRPDAIYVTTNQGTAMLYGFVANPSVKQHASRIAQSVNGVQNVWNSIGITGAGTSSALGYIPGQENQFGNQQYENEQPGSEGYPTNESDMQ